MVRFSRQSNSLAVVRQSLNCAAEVVQANGHLIDCTPQLAAAKCCSALIKFEFVEIFHLFARRLSILPEECITANKEVQFSTEKAAQCILW